MSLENLTELERFAVQLAIEAPLKQNQWTREARVTWRTINKLRDALRERGIDVDALTKARMRIQRGEK